MHEEWSEKKRSDIDYEKWLQRCGSRIHMSKKQPIYILKLQEFQLGYLVVLSRSVCERYRQPNEMNTWNSSSVPKLFPGLPIMLSPDNYIVPQFKWEEQKLVRFIKERIIEVFRQRFHRSGLLWVHLPKSSTKSFDSQGSGQPTQQGSSEQQPIYHYSSSLKQ